MICILGVVYVHAWTGLTGAQLAAQAGSAQDLFRWVLMEGLGKSAVPLLGMISGYLVAGSRRTRDWRGHMVAKGRTILLPMLLWNGLAILCVSGAAGLGWIEAPTPRSLDWWVQELMALSRPQDINVQMPFLRDLFVCMAFAPLLVRLPVRGLMLVVLGIALLAIGGWPQPLFLRPIILFFFTTGMIARLTGMAERAAAFPLMAAFLPFLLLLPVKIALSLPPFSFWENHWHEMTALDLIARLAVALFFWRTAAALAQSRVASWLLAAEPYAFFLFCCHLILIWLFGPLLGQLSGPLGAPLYPAFLLFQPLLWMGMAVLLGAALSYIWPAAARILSGGRLSGSGKGRR